MASNSGIQIDPAGVKSAAQALRGIERDSMAQLYQDFGGRTGFAIGKNPITILGTRDARNDVLSPEFLAAGADVVDAWRTFCTDWGAFIDEAVGIVAAMADALYQSANIYDGSDQDAYHFEQHTAGAALANSTTNANDTDTALRNLTDSILQAQPAYQSTPPNGIPSYASYAGPLASNIERGFNDGMTLKLGDPASDLSS